MTSKPADRARSWLSRPGESHDHDRGGRHWESWGLRWLLAAIVVFHLIGGNRSGAMVAGLGLAAAMVPPVISHFSTWHVPRMLELTFVLAMFLQYVSESFKLFELFTYWDKLVHPAEILLASAVVAFLFLGYTELRRLDIPDGLSAAGAMLFGMALGTSWELLEFALDWFGNANLQKSNADTLTDVLTNNIGAIFGTLLAFWVYRHRTSHHQRQELGQLAAWLTDRLTRLFERHGFLIGLVFALLLAAILAAGWLTDRDPIPGPPPGQGQARSWVFLPGSDSSGSFAAIVGDWHSDERGICRVNPERPQPGSEKMGLLSLEPGSSYGYREAYALSTRFFLERPPNGAGTAMEAGVAFGLRGPDDFYLLKASALHDALILERFLHGKRRDMRDERLRLRANEWHELRLEVRGDQLTAFSDGRPIFEENGLLETAGGLGLWARATSPGCFSEARAEPIK